MFCFRLIENQQIVSSTTNTTPWLNEDAALYLSNSSLLYKNVLRWTVGKKFKEKVQSCYQDNIPQGIIRAAVMYTEEMSQKQEIKSIQAYVINTINLIMSGTIKTGDKFWSVA